MILLNFAHPLTDDQRATIAALTGTDIERTIEIRSQVDAQAPLADQVEAMIEDAGLTASEWQSAPILVNPPSLNYSAVALLALLHGRMGYFPACLRLRPVAGSLPPRFEVAEILNLQSLRETARHHR